MKRLIYLFICITAPMLAKAQNAKCPYGVNATVFTTNFNQVKSTYDTYQKLTSAKAFVQTNCLTSYQVKQIASLLFSDQDRLEFCKMAYHTTTDQENFYDVYDAFAYFSNVFRLHDYVWQAKGTQWQTSPIEIPNTNPSYAWPNLPYPNHSIYAGTKGCNNPATESDFNLMVAEALKKTTDDLRMEYLKSLQNSYCLTTTYIMKLSTLITNEATRLAWLKAAYPKAYDRDNYSNCEAALSTDAYKKELAFMLKSGTNTGCFVNETDFASIKESISKESFNNTRLTITKQILASKKCFSAVQIKEIVSLFDFEASKLEIAKYAYDYCIDKDNYYVINDAFSFSSSKTDLNEYIKGK